MKKKTLAATLVTAFVLCAGIAAYFTTAEASLCTVTYLDACTVQTCCPEYVKASPNCRGPKCEFEWVIVCRTENLCF